MTSTDSQAEKHLIDLIRGGDQDGWAQFVARYQGRMLAFARRQVGDNDCDDVVQETFVAFLRSLESYRGESSLESWLFRILRRRIIDHYRSRGTRHEIAACAFATPSSGRESLDPLDQAADHGRSPSAHLQNQELRVRDQQRLSDALHTVVDRLQQRSNLRDLMILEGLFYAGIKNRVLAEMIEIDEGTIALVRHRSVKRLQSALKESECDDDTGGELQDDLLSTIWEQERPSCPKRSTLGKSLLRILDVPWQNYIVFHVDKLQCRYCLANQEDLALPSANNADQRNQAAVQRIFDSTIGFMREVR